MRLPIRGLALMILAAVVTATPGRAAEPDYSAWGQLLARYYDPGKGMQYAQLAAREKPTLATLKRMLGQVDVARLSKPEQLAYWINVYNVNVVALVVDSYPVESIRDLSTDPLIRLNVFKKEIVPTRGGTISLDDVENDFIRKGFEDPRIHFAINCAAESCPPIRSEPFVGARIDAQLDDQARRFFTGPRGLRFRKRGDTLVVHASKILDWFSDDFEDWGGGKVAFLARVATPEQARMLLGAKQVDFEYDEYSWKLNDASRP